MELQDCGDILCFMWNSRPRDRLSAQVTLEEIRQAQRAEKEQEKIKKSMKARMDFLDLD